MKVRITVNAEKRSIRKTENQFRYREEAISGAGELLGAKEGSGELTESEYGTCVAGLLEALGTLKPQDRSLIEIGSECEPFLQGVLSLNRWARDDFRKSNGQKVAHAAEWAKIRSALIGHSFGLLK